MTPDAATPDPEALLDDQAVRWRRGDRVPVEAYLAAHPALPGRADVVLDLITNEILLRKLAGEEPALGEYQRRFPHLADELATQFEVEFAIEADPAGATRLAPPAVTALTEAVAPAAPAGPPQVPGYEVMGELGRGAMGVVYRARERKLGRVVALKLVRPLALAAPEELSALGQRQRTEAEALARLQHPDIVQIFELGDCGGLTFLALEYVAGGSLARKLDGTPLPPDQAAALAERLARAMHAAHGCGVLHRDLKPDNILLTPEGQPKITDFGLAKRLDGEAGQTASGALLGTPSYMAPEQAEGRTAEVGVASDVYALGAVLYEMLTGRPPFRAATTLETLLQVKMEEPVPPRRLNPAVPRDLETVRLKCLQKQPGRRYASALALADDLRCFQDQRPIEARPAGPRERVLKWARRKPAVAGLLAAMALVTLAGVVLVAWQWRLAELARIDETSARLRAEEEAYMGGVVLAHRAWVSGNAAADELLGECRPRLRHWEWHYINGQRGTPRAAWRTDHAGRVPLAFVGGRLFTAGSDGTVRAWDASSGGELWRRDSPCPEVNALACSPDGRRLALAGSDGKVHLWRAADGGAVRRLPGHEGAAHCVAFRADGERLASGGADGAVRVWDPSTGKDVATYRDHTGAVLWVAYRPRAAMTAAWGCDLLSLGRSGHARVIGWDSETNKAVLPELPYMANITALACSRDGKYLASGHAAGLLMVRNLLQDKDEGATYTAGDPISQLCFAADGEGVVAISGLQNMSFAFSHVSVSAGKRDWRLAAVHGHTSAMAGVASEAAGDRFASASYDGEVRVWGWDEAYTQEARFLPQRSELGTFWAAFSPDGRLVAEAAPGGHDPSWPRNATVILSDPRTGREVRTITCRGQSPPTLAFSPDGKRLAGDDDGTVRLWDVADGKEARAFDGRAPAPDFPDLTREGMYPSALAFDATGTRLTWADSRGAVKVWDAGNGRLIGGFDFGAPAGTRCAVALGAGGQRLAVASGAAPTGAVVWDVPAGEVLRRLPHPTGPAPAIALSRDGRYLAFAGDMMLGTSRLALWDLRDGRQLWGASGNVLRTGALAFTPDGRRLATLGWDRTVKIWDAARGRELISLVASPRGNGLVFSDDGEYLAKSDNHLRIWRAPGMAAQMRK